MKPKIFESPDGGKTVFERDERSVTRKLSAIRRNHEIAHEKMIEESNWLAILRAAKTDPRLQAEVDRVRMFYELMKK